MHAVRLNLPDRYRAYAKMVNEQENHLKTIRGLFRIKSAASPPSPEFERPPNELTAIASVSCASLEIEPYDIGRPLAPLGDQAGRVGPLRRHDGIPRQRRHDADHS
jgi:hypothetical protein